MVCYAYAILSTITQKSMNKRHSKPFLLISNDDGYQARGINFLVEVLSPVADILVVAPDGPRSGNACKITFDEPVRCRCISHRPGLAIYACSGTPVDCVKLAVSRLLKGRVPDLVIGGINHGDNASINAHYSGTMGVATEGALQGFPSIAFSLCDHSPEANFEPLRPYIVDLMFKAISIGMPPMTCLNVNFPKVSKFKGVKVCRMAHSRWINEFCQRKDPRTGAPYYWLTGESVNLDEGAQDTDQWALANDFVAVTPTTFDCTAYGLLESFTKIL